MTNDFLPEIFSAYLDEEAALAERAEVERRLNDSPSEREALAELEQISADLRSLPKSELPDNFAARVMAAAEREMLIPVGKTETQSGVDKENPAVRSSWLRRIVPLATTAAALLLCWKLLGPVAPRLADQPGNAENVTDSENPTEERLAANSRSPHPLRTELGKKTLEGNKPAGPIAKEQDGAGKEAGVDIANDESRYQEPLVPPVNMTPGISGASNLVFVDDLRKLTPADVGRVVTAVENTEAGVAVVRLTVVDCGEGLDALQLLLSRNAIQRLPADFPVADGQIANTVTAKKSPEQLVAVYVQSTSDRLSTALAELQAEQKFRSLEAGQTIAASQIDNVAQQHLAQLDDNRDNNGLRVPAADFTMRSRTLMKHRGFAAPAPNGAGPVSKEKSVRKSDPLTGTGGGFGGASKGSPTTVAKNANKSLPEAKIAGKQQTVAEFNRISRQLKLTVPADLLQNTPAFAQQLQVTGEKSNGGITAATTSPKDEKRAKPIRVLFVVVCSPEAEADKPAAKPAASQSDSDPDGPA